MNRKTPVRFKPALPPAAQTRSDPAAQEQDNIRRRPGARLEKIATLTQAAKNYCGEAEPRRRDDEAQRCMGCRCCAEKRSSRAVVRSESESDSDEELERIIRGLSKSRN